MDLKDIKAIVDLMKKNSISEFELERQDFKIKMKRGPDFHESEGHSSLVPDQGYVNYLPASGKVPPSLQYPEELEEEEPVKEFDITSPMVGTFYRASSPESPMYVEVGTEIGHESIVCIIEAMKVMNEIKAETKGIVTKVLIENGKPIEFGQPIFKVRPLS